MTTRLPAALLLAMAPLLLVGCGGCGRSSPDAAPHPGRKVTWDEYQKLDAEQKTDPYVLNNLEDDAKKKRAEKDRMKK